MCSLHFGVEQRHLRVERIKKTKTKSDMGNLIRGLGDSQRIAQVIARVKDFPKNI